MQLVLNAYGSSLRVEQGQFCVETTDGKHHVHPESIRSILISKSARVSADAVLLAIEHEIDLLFVDKSGQPQGRVWSYRYGSVSEIRKGQLEFLYSNQSKKWVIDLLSRKINNQIALLLAKEHLLDESGKKSLQLALNAMEDHKRKIRAVEGDTLSDIAPSLRGWEGAVAKRYFQSLNLFLPPSYQFAQRSLHPAKDRFNALLNYAYGMLYGKVEGALVKAGLDPYLGVFHRDQYNRPALVFDLIECYRIWADHVVIELARQEVLHEDSFEDREGGVWLEGLGKRILIQSVNDYLGEIIPMNGLDRSRQTHIELEAHALAQLFLKYRKS